MPIKAGTRAKLLKNYQSSWKDTKNNLETTGNVSTKQVTRKQVKV